MIIKNQAQLITYPDSLGGDLKTLRELLLEHFDGVFGGLHILPPFPSSGDRGFAPITYTEIDPAFGTWDDVRRLAERWDILVDLMVNHISRRSPYFQDFAAHGRASPYADLFITLDKIWPGGEAPPADVARIFLRRPENPFSTIRIADTGAEERIWTTFGRGQQSEQIDIDVRSPAARELLASYLRFFAGQGIKIVRLDAIGYVIKQAGTSCFMVEPEIYEFIDWLMEVARALGLALLPELHAPVEVQRRLAVRGYWVYDFVLPGLILHTLLTGSGAKLAGYLATCPPRQVTMLDCHDGIPVQPDLDGILTPGEVRGLVDTCVARGANVSPLLGSYATESGLNAHQINCTYYSALGEDDDAYVAARALQLFAPGVPQVYYVGLLAGRNDAQAVHATGEGRAINRHNYSAAEVASAVEQPVVQRLLHLIRFRNEHPAFDGRFNVMGHDDGRIALAWDSETAMCRLDVDLATRKTLISTTDEAGHKIQFTV